MTVRLIRNATLVVELHGTTILVDPMLDPKDARPPIQNTEPQDRNPLVGLPEDPQQLVDQADAVLVTHLHADHFDDTAAELIGDTKPVYCQPEDVEALQGKGVTDLHPVDDTADLNGITITRTLAQHGFGKVAELLAPVSGFVLNDLYIAGDTVFFYGVQRAITAHRPKTIVLNAGGARFVDSERIIMDVEDVKQVKRIAGGAQIIAAHLEAINHCPVTRAQLRAIGVEAPDDGATIEPRS